MTYSFIIPVYNCKGYLPGCVESIREAGAEDYEIILVDDGSADGSSGLCDELAARYPEVKAVHQTNGGASAARNRGLREARGEYILFFDADDTIDAPALKEILADARCGDADLTVFGISFDYYYHGKCYRSDELYHSHDGLMTKEQWGEGFLRLYRDNSLSPVWNKVFRKELLEGMELDEAMFLYEDLEFSLRYLSRCEKIFNVPKAVYHYRQPEDEGNAGRRLKRVARIPNLLQPMEKAAEAVCRENPAVSRRDAKEMLLELYLVLAREKISVSTLEETKTVCADFAAWAKAHDCRAPEHNAKFYSRLLQGRVFALKLADQKTALRHKLAVWVKSHLRK